MKKSLTKKILIASAAFIVAAAVILTSIYFGIFGVYFSTTDWVIGMIDKYYYYEVDAQDVREAGLENLAGNVLDIYSGYYTAEEYKALTQSNAGNSTGIGVSVSYVDNSFGKGVFVNEVVGNSPAYRSGLKAGTFITGATSGDGQTVQFGSSSAFSDFVSARATGEQFTLITDRGEFTVSREAYHSSYCFMATSDAEWNIEYDGSKREIVKTSSDEYSFLPEGAAYLRVTQFYGDAAAETAELIGEFNDKGCHSLILDLRNNGGGYVDVMQEMAYVFVGSRDYMSAAMTARYKDGSETVFPVTAEAIKSCLFPADCELYILANNGTASASEALIGVLVSNSVADYSDIYLSDFSQAYLDWSGMAEKNCRTYGKGIMQTTYRYIVTGEAIKLTTAEIFWPNGNCIHGVGLTQEDGCNTVGAEWSVTYSDEELRAAAAMIFN